MDCSNYSDCVEAEYLWCLSGYPLGYGLKYCNKFVDNFDLYNVDGQAWIEGTLICLKEALLPLDLDNT